MVYGKYFWTFCKDNLTKIEVNGEILETFKEIPGNIYSSLENTTEKFFDKEALFEEGRSMTYGQFKKHVDSFSISLYNQYGIRKGDRIALLMVNSIDFCIAFYAAAKIGAIVVPLSTKLKETELVHPLVNSGAKLLILNEKWWGNVKDIIHLTQINKVIVSGKVHDKTIGQSLDDLTKLECTERYSENVDLKDPIVLMYTSGTTGVPKGALLSHLNILHGVICYKEAFNLSEHDSTIIAVPIFHITGLAALMALFVYIGGTIVLHQYFNAQRVIEDIIARNITFFHASPTVFILLLEQSKKYGEIKGIRKFACGSANMPLGVLDKLKKWLPEMKFHTVYGLTETSSPATIMPDDVYEIGKRGSSGLPIPGIEMKVVDDEGNELPEDSIGELLIKGSTVMLRYWNEQQNRQFRRNGWFYSGDLARIDKDGFVYIVDRKKDMINRGGEKIYSIEVENIIYNHPAVKEVAVFGVPDDLYGEVPKAAITLNEGFNLTKDEIQEYVAERLAKYKVPVYVEFVSEIPHTNNGKISKKMLKAFMEKKIEHKEWSYESKVCFCRRSSETYKLW